ncbi:hypothetical protein BGZ61DRAFT_547710 [Ilyonectria robusta]|uniref:uncharacterized protein n=1 Tax=Ilyonectria robusta TaxID=1079257 RepID=UPI001E8E6EAD|nr:uncharacterized protein BGZ61DRAFT_547710 [Ilyonectria robusta]KAH8648828.1 hypothetical protein BGZ61DRAFT_547710 [Ilyonectria robusta]
MLALCWPIALVLLCLISLGSCAFASHSTRHGGSRNAWLSLAWVPLAWARIKTGCRRRMHKTEKVTVEQRADVENQIANHLQSKTQPEPVSTADERDTGNFNYDSSRPGPPVGIMNGTGVARHTPRHSRLVHWPLCGDQQWDVIIDSSTLSEHGLLGMNSEYRYCSFDMLRYGISLHRESLTSNLCPGFLVQPHSLCHYYLVSFNGFLSLVVSYEKFRELKEILREPPAS